MRFRPSLTSMYEWAVSLLNSNIFVVDVVVVVVFLRSPYTSTEIDNLNNYYYISRKLRLAHVVSTRTYTAAVYERGISGMQACKLNI